MEPPLPSVALDEVSTATAEQMREIDRVAVEEFGIEIVQMMEHAGRALARIARAHLDETVAGRKIVVLAGTGGNGGGGLVAARNLSNWGASVLVARSGPIRAGAAAHQLATVLAMDIHMLDDDSIPETEPELVLDALIGYSLREAAHGRARDLIAWANSQPVPVLSLDVPSGLDPDTGDCEGACVRPHATVTLALPKPGLTRATAGELYLVDIGIPPAAYRAAGTRYPTAFERADLVLLDR